jgi:hypothetical protein
MQPKAVANAGIALRAGGAARRGAVRRRPRVWTVDLRFSRSSGNCQTTHGACGEDARVTRGQRAASARGTSVETTPDARRFIRFAHLPRRNRRPCTTTRNNPLFQRYLRRFHAA